LNFLFWSFGIVCDLVLGAWNFQRCALVMGYKGEWWMPRHQKAMKDAA
jgi:hypothetical protein